MKSKNNIINLENKIYVIKKIIDIVVNCCINFVIIDNKLYIANRKYKNLNLILNL